MESLKEIHLGELVKQKVEELNFPLPKLAQYFKCTEEDILELYQQKHLPTDVVLKFCKCLGYNFFRVLSAHVALFVKTGDRNRFNQPAVTPQFKKNIYTKEIKDFILSILRSKKMNINQIMKEYNLPKTTLYNWINKEMTFEEKNELFRK